MSPPAPLLPLRQSLRFRVYLLVSVGVLLPAVTIGVVSRSRLQDLDEELLAARRAAAVAVAEHVEEVLTGDLEALQRLASSPALAARGEHPDAANALLRAITQHSGLRGAFLADAAGHVVREEPGEGSAGAIAGLPELARTLADGKPRVTGLVGEGKAARTVALVAIADWHGKPSGVVGGVVDFAAPARARVLGHLLRGRAGYADLVDSAGRILASTDPARVQRRAECAARLGRLVEARQAEVVRCSDCHARGRDVGAFAPVRNAPWGVSVVQSERLVLATSGGLFETLPALAATLFLVAVIFGWGAARSVTRPIEVLTGAAERVAAGGMDEPVPAVGEDELGRLGRSIEHMRASLRELLARLAHANEDLEQRVEERTRALAEANEQLRLRDAQRQRLLRTVITAQEDERKRIARELHDETTQSLAVLAMGLESASHALHSGGPQPRLDEVKAVAVRTLEEVHRLILDLRPAVLDDLGLFSAVRWYAERTLASRGLAVRCEIRELDRRLPNETEIALFRMAQEAMNNIARHAKADSVLIQLGPEDGELVLEIEDDGQGFEPGQAPTDRPHYGLLGLQERAELLGGAVRLESSPGNGTRIEIRVPIPDEPRLPTAPRPD